jgi:Zn-dependent protease
MILILMLFVCVLMHEYGHALMARRFGVGTQDIILSPIGGIARLNKLPEKPLQEFLVAIAGPAVNLVIVLLLSPLYYGVISAADRSNLLNSIFNASGNYFAPDLSLSGFLIVGLFWLNIILAIFNMLPAFPMDGGRVLRALLSLKLDRTKATLYAARIGQLFAIAFAAIGLFSQPMNFLYVFIGVFIFLTAGNEYRMVKIEKALKSASGKMLGTDKRAFLHFQDSIDKAAQIVQDTDIKSFLVFDNWQNPMGVLTAETILKVLKQGKALQPVAEAQLHSISGVNELSSLDTIYTLIQNQQQPALVTFDKFGNATGIVDSYMLNRFIKEAR